MNGEKMEIRGQVVHPTLLKIVIACAVAIGALAGFGTWKYLTSKPIRDESDAQARPAAVAVRTHNYDLKEGIDYGYTVLITDEQRKAGKAGAEILMVSYAGQRDGKYQVHERRANMLTAYECASPCEIVKIISAIDADGLRGTTSTERLRASPNMIAALALQDAMNGKLEPYAEYQGKRRFELWVDEHRGIIRTALK